MFVKLLRWMGIYKDLTKGKTVYLLVDGDKLEGSIIERPYKDVVVIRLK